MSKKFATTREADAYYNDWVKPIIDILRGNVYAYQRNSRNQYEYVQTYAGRPWFIQQHGRHRLHAAVYDMLAVYQPNSLSALILE